jgi:uncharacterized alkaline shock family protein YloU
VPRPNGGSSDAGIPAAGDGGVPAPDPSVHGARTTPVAELVLARAVRAAVNGMADVRGLSAGVVAEVATYGPGEWVQGVAVSRATGVLTVAVHVVATYRPTLVLPELADQVRTTIRQAVSACGAGPVGRIDVAIDDVWVTEGQDR